MTQVQRRHQRRRRRSQRHEKNERQAALLSAGSLLKWSVIRDLWCCWREHAEQQTFRIKPLLNKVVAGSRSFLLSLLDGAFLKHFSSRSHVLIADFDLLGKQVNWIITGETWTDERFHRFIQ